MIDHQGNGYLAQAYNTEDLAAGIEWVLGELDRSRELRVAARKKALDSFDYPVVASRYIELYKSILGGVK